MSRPTGAALLHLVATAYMYRFPAGTNGHQQDRERSRHPTPGDFVLITGVLSRKPEQLMGWLLRITPASSEYLTKYLIECVDGSQLEWSNVHVTAIPVGDLFEYGDEAKRWQLPAEKGGRSDSGTPTK